MARTKPTMKQKMFCEYYLQSWNATLAAEQAGYKGNKASWASIGYENLLKPYIKDYIEKRFSETVMTSNEVLSRLKSMARSFDMSKYIELKERFEIVTKKVGDEVKHYKEFAGYVVSFNLEKLQDDGFSHLIKNIKQTNRGLTIEWHDQMAALVHIGKHHGLFTENVDVTSGGKVIKVNIGSS